MDDSVIKVLRRNGSWEKSNKKQEIKKSFKNDLSTFKAPEEDFQLDEKFQILASEIKKRMNKKGTNVNENVEIKDGNKKISKPVFQDIGKLKSQILPYLKKIEQLIIRKQNYLNSISEVDKELDIIYDDITKIKENYLDTINKLKNNMDFFDDSLDIIKSAKEEK